MAFRWLTTLILGLHFAFLIYVVLGGFVAWRWPRAIWPHLVAAAWGLVVVVAQLTCPLTTAEDWSRRRAGEAGVTVGFIDRYVEGVLYPERYTGLMQGLVVVVVAGSWLGAWLRYRRRRVAAVRAPARQPSGPARSRWRSRT